MRLSLTQTLLSACMVLSGCTAGATEVAGTATDELLASHRVVATATWQSAPAGCEDAAFDASAEIAEAEDAPELGVVLVDGRVLCVDAIEIIAEHARALGLIDPRGARSGDPFPHPSSPIDVDPRGARSGDPFPHPSSPADTDPRGARSGDPFPHPSSPADADPRGTRSGDPFPHPSRGGKNDETASSACPSSSSGSSSSGTTPSTATSSQSNSSTR